MKVIISETITSLALIVALSTPGTSAQTAPAASDDRTRMLQNNHVGRPDGSVRPSPAVTKAPKYI